MMLATRNDITDYIPQRHPFVMVHNLLEATKDRATSQFEILSNNLLVRDGVFSESGLVENIAQTVAAQAGYFAKSQNQAAPLGYIANIKDLKVSGLAPVGATLTTSVHVVNQVFDMTLCQAEVTLNDQVICKCEIRIFVKSSLNQY